MAAMNPWQAAFGRFLEIVREDHGDYITGEYLSRLDDPIVYDWAIAHLASPSKPNPTQAKPIQSDPLMGIDLGDPLEIQ